MNLQPMYKVLKNGESTHGGSLTWSLPREKAQGGWRAGGWHTVEQRPIVCCQTGIHLTTEPMKWAVANMEVYLAEGRGDRHNDGSDKTAFAEGRLLRPAPEVIPAWWQSSMTFINEDIPAVSWLKPDENPDPAWQLFTGPTLDAAWDAAGDAAGAAAWDAAGDAAWAAARDARLYTLTEHICGDLDIDQKHRDHVRARWNVWQKGYALLCDVNGVLYVYGVQS